ncbi:class I SAM-dependent methyltransferase [Streptosporangium lutulentum]
MFAETFADAEAVAVDGAPGLLDRALARAERLGLGGRVAVRHAELPEGLDGDDEHGEGGLGTADLIWSSKAVHHLGDQQGALNALAGALRPGGLLAVAEGGLPMRFLPRDIGIGRPGLQARLDVVQEDWFEIMRAELPGSTTVVEDWPAMLSRAGLTRTGGFTSLLDLQAPLGEAARAFLHAHLTRLRETTSEFLDTEDRGTLDVLLDPVAPGASCGGPTPSSSPPPRSSRACDRREEEPGQWTETRNGRPGPAGARRPCRCPRSASASPAR